MSTETYASPRRRHWFGLTGKETYKQTLHLLLDLPIGIATFTVAVSLVTTSAALVVTLIGLPLLAASLVAAREMAKLERARARLLLGVDLPEPAAVPSGRRRLTDATGWRAVAYAVVMLPLGVATSTIAVTGWSTAATALVYPAYAPFLDKSSVTVGSTTIGGPGWQVATSVAGAVLLLSMPAIVRGLARLDIAVMRRLLA